MICAREYVQNIIHCELKKEPGEKKQEQEHKMRKKKPKKEGGGEKTRGKRKETWHFSRTLSCRPADIIIVKLGGRFRLSCRCGSLKSHSMSLCHFSSTSLPSNPSFTHSAPRARRVRTTACPCGRTEQENVMARRRVFYCVLSKIA